MSRPRVLLLALLVGVVAACGASDAGTDGEAAQDADALAPDLTVPTSSTTSEGRSTPTTVPEVVSAAAPRPVWLGTRVLPIDEATGIGVVLPTPPELVDRRLETPDHLPPPPTDEFGSAVEPVPAEVLQRSTWSSECPVAAEDLRYVTVVFRGFDDQAHTGELLVHADAADTIVAGFRSLYERDFPIEEMRITRPEELDAPPTGDGNNTTAFVCRPSVGSTKWSEHAYGRAVDINPFHNPYVRGDFLVPELASAYTDRSNHRPGMLTAEDVTAFVDAGWGWGGNWSSAKDHMHLSASGR